MEAISRSLPNFSLFITVVFSLLFSGEIQALEDSIDSTKFFPIGVYFVRGQKPVEMGEPGDPAYVPLKGDYRFNPEVAEEEYLREFRDLRSYGFNTAILMIDPLVHPAADKSTADAVVDGLIRAAERASIQIVAPMNRTAAMLGDRKDVLTRKEIDSVLQDDHIAQFRSSEATLGYQIFDEPVPYGYGGMLGPYTNEVREEQLGQVKDAILHQDTDAFVLSTWNNVESMELLDLGMRPDVLLMDLYPFALDDYNGDQADGDTPPGDLSDAFPRGRAEDGSFNAGGDQPTFTESLLRAQRIARGKPVWVAFQAFGGATYWRKPQPKELRLQAFTAIKNGAKGLFYFMYQSEDWADGLMDIDYRETPLVREAKEINETVQALAPTLLGLSLTENRAHISSGKGEAQTFRDGEGEKYLIVVNGDVTRQRNIKVDIERSWVGNADRLEAIDLYTQERFEHESVGDGSISIVVPVEPGDGRVLQLLPGDPDESFASTSDPASPIPDGDVLLFQSDASERIFSDTQLVDGVEIAPANDDIHVGNLFARLGDLRELAGEGFAEFRYSLYVNDGGDPSQRYQIGVRFGNDEGGWSESRFFSTAYVVVGDGWQRLEFDIADLVNQQLSLGNRYLTRIFVRAYNPDGYVEYRIRGVELSYRKLASSAGADETPSSEPPAPAPGPAPAGDIPLFQPDVGEGVFSGTQVVDSVEVAPANDDIHVGNLFARLGDLRELAGEGFAEFRYSLYVNDGGDPSQRYQIGVRFGNDEGGWSESRFFSTAYVVVGDGWQRLEFDIADLVNQQLSLGNRYLTRIFVRAYNPSGYASYQVRNVEISYRTRDELSAGNESPVNDELPVEDEPSPGDESSVEDEPPAGDESPGGDKPPAGDESGAGSNYPQDRPSYVHLERHTGLPMPAFGESIEDPATGTYITRITDIADDCWRRYGDYPRHEYSKVQPWNADQTMYRFYAVAIYDAHSYQPIRCLPNLHVARWSHVDPHVIYAFKPNQRRILRYDTETQLTEEVLDLSGECDHMVLGPGEGNMDIRDRRVALACRVDTNDAENSDLKIVVVDLQDGEVVARRTLPGAWRGRGDRPGLFDWISVSQLGEYVVLNWSSNLNQANPFTENDQEHYGVEVYDSDTLTFQRRLWHYGNHGDLCVDSAGDEVYVQFNGPAGSYVNMYRLRDGEHTPLISEEQGPGDDIRADFPGHEGHISCRNIGRPGWAYVSLEYRKGISPPETRNEGVLLAVKLDGSGTVENFGHHQSSAINYAKSVKLAPSPDGTQVMFTSDWGNDQDMELTYEFVASAVSPMAESSDPGAVALLKNASSWMYQIDELQQPGAVETLAASGYSLLVIDPTYTLTDESDFDIVSALSALQRRPDGKRRLVLAYINIGQAESYRSYWQADWTAPTSDSGGTPDFLISVDPDGWSENYPVAYWDSRWQDLWLGEGGMVAELVRLGFDGVYLDWVDAYQDDSVAQAAQEAGVDASREMVDFIGRIRAAGRAINGEFLVVAQNAPYLIDAVAEYGQVIDALGVEDTWFGGQAGADWDDPQAGDIPNGYSDGFSTSGLLAQYRKYQRLGLPVFSIDYCLNPENARQVYRDARAAGLVPLVTRVSLSRMTETPPMAY